MTGLALQRDAPGPKRSFVRRFADGRFIPFPDLRSCDLQCSWARKLRLGRLVAWAADNLLTSHRKKTQPLYVDRRCGII
jgi:hypothetical protein